MTFDVGVVGGVSPVVGLDAGGSVVVDLGRPGTDSDMCVFTTRVVVSLVNSWTVTVYVPSDRVSWARYR